jgi:hypothetical protein
MSEEQQMSFSDLQPEAMKSLPFSKATKPRALPATRSHPFWDQKNSFLFATTAALSTVDFLGKLEVTCVTEVTS